MKMIDKVKEAEKLIVDLEKSKKQNVWLAAENAMRALDELKYELERKERK